MLKGFLCGARAVPPLANVGIDMTIPTRAQQKWPCSGAVDWLNRQSYGSNVVIACGAVGELYHWDLNGDFITNVPISVNTVFDVQFNNASKKYPILSVCGDGPEVDLFLNLGYSSFVLETKRCYDGFRSRGIQWAQSLYTKNYPEYRKSDFRICLVEGVFGRVEFNERAPFLMAMDIDELALVFWEEVSVKFKNWWNSQHGEQYPTRTKPFGGFMKRLGRMFENPTLDDEQLASHMWNILPPCGRAQWMGANQKYIDHRVGLALPRFYFVVV
uniref:Uncharacterized protein n=1 Tax=Romanomermis culicivorax TaxID=13658 RepID=A0A915KEF5_ROMCU